MPSRKAIFVPIFIMAAGEFIVRHLQDNYYPYVAAKALKTDKAIIPYNAKDVFGQIEAAQKGGKAILCFYALNDFERTEVIISQIVTSFSEHHGPQDKLVLVDLSRLGKEGQSSQYQKFYELYEALYGDPYSQDHKGDTPPKIIVYSNDYMLAEKVFEDKDILSVMFINKTIAGILSKQDFTPIAHVNLRFLGPGFDL